MSINYFERVLLLTQVPLFSYLRSDQLNHLAPLLRPVAWTMGDCIFELGDIGLEFYILTSGRVGVCLDPDNQNALRVYVNELGVGDCLGEMALMDDEPRSATAYALEDTEALALDKDRLHGLLMSYPELGIGMLRAMSQRLRAISARESVHGKSKA